MKLKNCWVGAKHQLPTERTLFRGKRSNISFISGFVEIEKTNIIIYQRNILYMSIAAKTELRLVNGPTSHEGRVEVKNNGIWGTICCNGFVVQSADVIYKSLGLKGYVVVFNLPLNEYVRLYSQCLSNHVHRLWTNMSDCTHSVTVTMFTAFERVCQTVLTVSE